MSKSEYRRMAAQSPVEAVEKLMIENESLRAENARLQAELANEIALGKTMARDLVAAEARVGEEKKP